MRSSLAAAGAGNALARTPATTTRRRILDRRPIAPGIAATQAFAQSGARRWTFGGGGLAPSTIGHGRMWDECQGRRAPRTPQTDSGRSTFSAIARLYDISS